MAPRLFRWGHAQLGPSPPPSAAAAALRVSPNRCPRLTGAWAQGHRVKRVKPVAPEVAAKTGAPSAAREGGPLSAALMRSPTGATVVSESIMLSVAAAAVAFELARKMREDAVKAEVSALWVVMRGDG